MTASCWVEVCPNCNAPIFHEGATRPSASNGPEQLRTVDRSEALRSEATGDGVEKLGTHADPCSAEGREPSARVGPGVKRYELPPLDPEAIRLNIARIREHLVR